MLLKAVVKVCFFKASVAYYIDLVKNMICQTNLENVKVEEGSKTSLPYFFSQKTQAYVLDKFSRNLEKRLNLWGSPTLCLN